MKQFILGERLIENSQITLDGDDFHYLCRVRRSGAGDSVVFRDREGSLFSAEMVSVSEDSCTLMIKELLSSSVRNYDIHLYLCLCKGKKQAAMIRQAGEAGVKSITLLDSRFSQVRFSGKEENKYERWRKIIREAQQQSGSGIQTELRPLIPFEDLPGIEEESSVAFFCHQEALGGSGLAMLHNKEIREISLVIGSEGGLAPEEIKIMLEKGFSSLYLGDNVLRAETASIFALGAVISHMEFL
jgi:16S rRNA (uracil1498-N3)-methyltransferase